LNKKDIKWPTVTLSPQLAGNGIDPQPVLKGKDLIKLDQNQKNLE
jgi:hypothetical protein